MDLLDPQKRALTPIMIAAAGGDIDSVKRLIASGAAVNARDNRGGTALMYAVQNQHTNIVSTLLKAGADPRLKTHRNISAISIAESNDFQDVLRLLRTAATLTHTPTPTIVPSRNSHPIRTHYDNLKVARDAPDEIIRAAYRTLLQKYASDPSQPNSDAAQIVSLLDSAYEVLSDPAKRRAYDQWISQAESATDSSEHAAEETRSRLHIDTDLRSNTNVASPSKDRNLFVTHMGRWWIVYLVGAAGIWAATRTTVPQKETPTENSVSIPQVETVPAPSMAEQTPRQSTNQTLAPQATPYGPSVPRPGFTPLPRSSYARSLMAPNGNVWPAGSGYISGYPRRFTEGYSSVTVDNSQNDGDVFVKLFALDTSPPSVIRTFLIRARSQFKVESIRAGTYDVRYQDLDSGALTKSESFNLEETRSEAGVRFSRLTMTLYKVAHGNMQTSAISDAEFQ